MPHGSWSNYQPVGNQCLANGCTNKYVSCSDQPKYKAQHIAKGFNYNEIFSPVVKMMTLRLCLGVVTTENLQLEKMDEKLAFLHEDLEEDIYMSQPAGFAGTGEESYLVC